jgi:hypothetical protein
MTKKGAKKQALGWIPSSFNEVDLKKVKREGFLSKSLILGDVSCYPPPCFLPSCTRISSWASVCVRRAAASAHAKFSDAHCLLHYYV